MRWCPRPRPSSSICVLSRRSLTPRVRLPVSSLTPWERTTTSCMAGLEDRRSSLTPPCWTPCWSRETRPASTWRRTRVSTWCVAVSSIRSVVGSTVIPRIPSGWCPTSRRCFTTMPCCWGRWLGAGVVQPITTRIVEISTPMPPVARCPGSTGRCSCRTGCMPPDSMPTPTTQPATPGRGFTTCGTRISSRTPWDPRRPSGCVHWCIWSPSTRTVWVLSRCADGSSGSASTSTWTPCWRLVIVVALLLATRRPSRRGTPCSSTGSSRPE